MKSSRVTAGPLFAGLVLLSYLAIQISLYPDVVFFGMSFCKRDILRYYHPVWHFMVESMKQGIVPLWNPYSNLGTPFLANIQSCVFYPLTVLLYLPDYIWGFNFYILLHLALAGFFTYLWMRDTGASIAGAYLAGLAFSLSGYVQSTINLTISLCALVYLPLVLLCFRRALRTSGLRWKALTALALAVQYLAGDPAVLFGTLVVCSLFALYRFFETFHETRRWTFGPLIVWTGIVSVFAALVLFQMLGFARLLFHSNRSALTYDDVTMWSMQYNDLLSFLVPYFSDASIKFMDYWIRQSWFENSYLGVTVLFLAGVAVKETRSKRMTGYLMLLAILGLALALGRFCSIHRVFFDYFPFFKFIRYPARFLFIFTFAVACLAGVGFDAIMSSSKKRSLVFPSVLLGGVGLFILWQAASPWVELRFYELFHEPFDALLKGRWNKWDTVEMVYPVLFNLKRSFCFLLFIAMAYAALTRLAMRRTIALVFMGALVFIDLAETNAVEFRVEREYLERVGHHMDHIRRDKGIFRANASPTAMNYQAQTPDEAKDISENLDHLLEVLSPNMHLLQKVAYKQSYDSISLRDFIDLNDKAHTVSDPEKHRYLDMLNIKYVVSLREELGPAYRKIQYAKPSYLYENTHVLPRAYLVPAHEVVIDRARILDRVVSSSFDPISSLILEEDPGILSSTGEVLKEGTVQIISYGINRVTMQVDSSQEQWLFFSDMYDSGWKALVNGRSEKVRRANYCFRAVRVPKGPSTVEWTYDPPGFRASVWISLLALAAVLWASFSGGGRRRP